MTKALTAQGTVLGTPQYMAPEQIEGKTADARRDIFALGCVIYEMVTGKRAFDGKSASMIAAGILAKEPEPLTTSAPLTPPLLEKIVRTCLAKDPNNRFQNARDLKLALQWVPNKSSALQRRLEGAGWVERLPARLHCWRWHLSGMAALHRPSRSAFRWQLPDSAPPSKIPRAGAVAGRQANSVYGIQFGRKASACGAFAGDRGNDAAGANRGSADRIVVPG